MHDYLSFSHLACDDGYFGMNCTRQCYCRYGTCIKATGICPTKGCQRGWNGDTCSEGNLQKIYSLFIKMSILFKIISSVEITIMSVYICIIGSIFVKWYTVQTIKYNVLKLNFSIMRKIKMLVSKIQKKYSSQPQLCKLKSNFAEVIRFEIRSTSFYSDLSHYMATRESLWFARYNNKKQYSSRKLQYIKRDWRYQKGNHNAQSDRHKTQLPKEKIATGLTMIYNKLWRKLRNAKYDSH